MITVAEIRAAEAEKDRVDGEIAAIGRAIYEIRNGKKLDSVYNFDTYYLTTFAGAHYCDQEGPDWGLDTPILSIKFWWCRAGHGETVTLPQSWLEQDWAALERDRIAAEQAAQAKAEQEAAVVRAAEREDSERRTYERLREKFEGPTT